MRARRPRDRPRFLRVGLRALAAGSLLSACLDMQGPTGVPDTSVTLAVRAWNGEPAVFDAAPRRPKLELHTEAGLVADEEPVLLFAGAADETLLEDLAAAPLRAEHQERLVAMEVVVGPTSVRATPSRVLSPGARYTVAVPGWARTQRGGPASDAPLIFALVTDGSPEGGADLLRTFPADGAVAIGTNLAAAVLAFDGRVQGVEEGVWLQDPQGGAVAARLESGACEDLAPAIAGSFCVKLTPASKLAPSALHALVIGSAARDAKGAPVGPAVVTFRTASGSDTAAPSLLPLACAVDEQPLALGCVLTSDRSIEWRARSDEGVLVSLQLASSSRGVRSAALDGAITLRLESLEPNTAIDATLLLEDAAQNQRREAMELHTAAPLATLAIAEVRADALGPEPAQEYVELWNYGERSLDLLGFSLHDRADEAGTAIERSLRVDPQTRVLLVADAFDARASLDVAPPPGAPLVRLGRSLASSGLANQGETVFLRDPLGRRVSAAPASPRPEPGVCIERRSEDPRDGSPAAFGLVEPCTPGR